MSMFTPPFPHTDEEDMSCVAAFTALPRTKWAEIRKKLEENPANRKIFKLIDSAIIVGILESEDVESTVCVLYLSCITDINDYILFVGFDSYCSDAVPWE